MGGLIGNCRPHCLQIDGIPISSHHRILQKHDALALKLGQPNQYFLNHHIHVEDVNIHEGCSAHLCTEVTLHPGWYYIQVEIRMKLCICSKIEYSLSHFGFCVACVTKAGIKVLLVFLYRKQGFRKDLEGHSNSDWSKENPGNSTAELMYTHTTHKLTPTSQRRVGKQCHLLAVAIFLCSFKL